MGENRPVIVYLKNKELKMKIFYENVAPEVIIPVFENGKWKLNDEDILPYGGQAVLDGQIVDHPLIDYRN